MNTIKMTCNVKSPLGTLLLVADAQGDALSGLYLERQKYYPDAGSWPDVPDLPVFDVAQAQLAGYFSGARTTFDVPLAPEGTPFQQDVWAAIRGVPFGETIPYAELARRVGRPAAVRAAGAATGRNPLTIMIPCHRIVGSDGALTGFAGGIDRKRVLLALEAGQLSRMVDVA
ncbi:MAG: methylated-DNA--[protein]-cysteine S-methyltransferase [Betaproteobacteria bacterium]